MVTLVDSRFDGTGNADSVPAILNRGAMLVRNVQTSSPERDLPICFEMVVASKDLKHGKFALES